MDYDYLKASCNKKHFKAYIDYKTCKKTVNKDFILEGTCSCFNFIFKNKNSAEVDIAPALGKIHITMQGFTLTAITDAEKTKLRL